jgi:hypothetical protein
MMTYGFDEVLKAAWTVASYLEKKLELIVPPTEGVMSCQARKGLKGRKTAQIEKIPKAVKCLSNWLSSKNNASAYEFGRC